MNNMLKTGFENFVYMLVIKRIIDGPSIAAGTNEPGVSEHSELMRNGTLPHFEAFGKVKYAHFTGGESNKNTHAAHIAENLIQLGQII